MYIYQLCSLYCSVKRYPGSWLEWIEKLPEVKKALEEGSKV